MIFKNSIFSDVFEQPHRSVFRRSDFKINNLFRRGEKGFWVSLSDFSSVFSDTSGTTIANVGDPVARINDKSGNGNHLTQANLAKRPILREAVTGKRYLEFDGIDDCLVTPTITPSGGTVQVFVGLEKSSDAARASLIYAPNAGFNAFFMEAPGAAGVAATGYIFYHSGATSLPGVSASFPAVDAAVLSMQSDINVPFLIGRRNGVNFGLTTASTGGGVFSSGVYTIGARDGGGARFLNGKLFEMVVRFGPTLPGSIIKASEVAVSKNTAGVKL